MIQEIIKKYGRLDILVNNAGVTRDNLIMKMSEEDFDAVIDTNLKGAFNCIKHVSRQMLKQRGGRIINISSVSGVMGNAGQANYCASKAGIIGLTKSVARELGSRGITCNAIAPGFIKTEMTEVLPEDVKKAMGEQIPLKTVWRDVGRGGGGGLFSVGLRVLYYGPGPFRRRRHGDVGCFNKELDHEQSCCNGHGGHYSHRERRRVFLERIEGEKKWASARSHILIRRSIRRSWRLR